MIWGLLIIFSAKWDINPYPKLCCIFIGHNIRMNELQFFYYYCVKRCRKHFVGPWGMSKMMAGICLAARPLIIAYTTSKGTKRKMYWTFKERFFRRRIEVLPEFTSHRNDLRTKMEKNVLGVMKVNYQLINVSIWDYIIKALFDNLFSNHLFSPSKRHRLQMLER